MNPPPCEVCGPGGAVDQESPEETGACPACGRELGERVKAPWHFKLLVVSLVIYLGWRAWQGIEWLLGKL